jgi:pimeloyl-ACP methyl ester carboxylesterase
VVGPILRIHGAAPFSVAVVHGGPGAGGEMAPVARALAVRRGVLEPIQTAASIDGQIEELREALETRGTPPVTLIGFSWGAWLSALLAARHPTLVAKLILVGSGPFEERYAAQIEATRRARLPADQAAEFDAILRSLRDPTPPGSEARIERLGALCERTDAFDPLPGPETDADRTAFRPDIFERVWREAAALRRSGALLDCLRQIQCPVVAIHGDYDPHPAAGVSDPLTRAVKAFRFVLLADCGHTPWLERRARTAFYRRLEDAILPATG